MIDINAAIKPDEARGNCSKNIFLLNFIDFMILNNLILDIFIATLNKYKLQIASINRNERKNSTNI